MKELSNKRNKNFFHKNEKKKILALYKRRDELRTARYSNYVEIEPYHHGYNRTYILRDDVKARTDAKYIEQALKLVNTITFCKNKKFQYKDFKTKKMVDIPMKLNDITFAKFNILDDKVKDFFELFYNIKNKCWVYKFRHTWMLVPKITKNYVTKAWVIIPEIEKELGEIESILESNMDMNISKYKYLSKSYNSYYDENEKYNRSMIKFNTSLILKNEL